MLGDLISQLAKNRLAIMPMRHDTHPMAELVLYICITLGLGNRKN
ncbi:hypothetical protein IFVP408_C210033 [Vibrio parahaemolyticus]